MAKYTYSSHRQWSSFRKLTTKEKSIHYFIATNIRNTFEKNPYQLQHLNSIADSVERYFNLAEDKRSQCQLCCVVVGDNLQIQLKASDEVLNKEIGDMKIAPYFDERNVNGGRDSIYMHHTLNFNVVRYTGAFSNDTESGFNRMKRVSNVLVMSAQQQ